jgi:hypothetical protein
VSLAAWSNPWRGRLGAAAQRRRRIPARTRSRFTREVSPYAPVWLKMSHAPSSAATPARCYCPAGGELDADARACGLRVDALDHPSVSVEGRRHPWRGHFDRTDRLLAPFAAEVAHAAFRTVVKLVSLRVPFCAAVAHFHPSANSCHRTDTSFAPFLRPLLDSSGGPTSIASLTRQN